MRTWSSKSAFSWYPTWCQPQVLSFHNPFQCGRSKHYNFIIYFQTSTSWSRLIYLATDSWFSPWSVKCINIPSSRCKPRNVFRDSTMWTRFIHKLFKARLSSRNSFTPTRSRDCCRFTAHVRCALRPIGKIDPWTLGPLDPWTLGLLHNFSDHFYWTNVWTLFLGPIFLDYFFGPFYWECRPLVLKEEEGWNAVLSVLRDGWEVDLLLMEWWRRTISTQGGVGGGCICKCYWLIMVIGPSGVPFGL